MDRAQLKARVLARGVLFVSMVSLGAGPAGAQTGPPVPPPQAVPTMEFPPTPPYVETVALQRPLWRLAVAEVVDRAFHNNLDLTIERYNQLLARERVRGVSGFYDPLVSFSSNAGTANNPLTAAPGDSQIPAETVKTSGFTPSIRQNLIGGGTATAALTNSQSLTSSLTPTVNPAFASGFSASITQPLLRGFGATLIDRQIGSGRLDVNIADAQYRQKVTFVLQQTLTQYWELVFAIESYETRRQSKGLALVQYENTKLRVQAGLLTPTALTASRAEIAGRERDMLLARVQIINAENALKQLLSEDPASPIWTMALIPTDRPEAEVSTPTLETALDAALAHRPEIEQLRFQSRQNQIDRKFFSWEKKPTVNLSGSFSALGKSGTVFQRVSGERLPDPANPSSGGYQNSWRQISGFDFPAWSLGLTVQVPVNNRAAAAQLVQADIAGDRLRTQMTRTQQSVIVEVRSSLEVIAMQKQSLDAAHLTTQLSEEQLEAQSARYEAGFSTDFELLRYQRDFVDAKVRELRALVDLQLAVLSLQKATDTLIEAQGATLAPIR
jgi:outer membrane protein TolC